MKVNKIEGLLLSGSDLAYFMEILNIFNKSLFDVTRKMVNYTWQGSSQGKL